jgi:hypothetical protein
MPASRASVPKRKISFRFYRVISISTCVALYLPRKAQVITKLRTARAPWPKTDLSAVAF